MTLKLLYDANDAGAGSGTQALTTSDLNTLLPERIIRESSIEGLTVIRETGLNLAETWRTVIFRLRGMTPTSNAGGAWTSSIRVQANGIEAAGSSDYNFTVYRFTASGPGIAYTNSSAAQITLGNFAQLSTNELADLEISLTLSGSSASIPFRPFITGISRPYNPPSGQYESAFAAYSPAYTNITDRRTMGLTITLSNAASNGHLQILGVPYR